MQETLASKAESRKGGGEDSQQVAPVAGACRCQQAVARVEGVALRLRTVEEMWTSELADVRQEVEACVSGGRAAVRSPRCRAPRACAAHGAIFAQWKLIRQVRAEEKAHQRAMHAAEAKQSEVEAQCGAMRARLEAMEGTATELGRQVAALKARLDRARERSARDVRRVRELEQENQGGWCRVLERPCARKLTRDALLPITPRHRAAGRHRDLTCALLTKCLFRQARAVKLIRWHASTIEKVGVCVPDAARDVCAEHSPTPTTLSSGCVRSLASPCAGSEIGLHRGVESRAPLCCRVAQ